MRANLKKARRDKGMTQQAMADYLGMSIAAVDSHRRKAVYPNNVLWFLDEPLILFDFAKSTPMDAEEKEFALEQAESIDA
jgi:hypothetical protein